MSSDIKILSEVSIKATFKGKDSSRGFINGQTYEFTVSQNPFTKATSIKSKEGHTMLLTSAAQLILNFDNITHI